MTTRALLPSSIPTRIAHLGDAAPRTAYGRNSTSHLRWDGMLLQENPATRTAHSAAGNSGPRDSVRPIRMAFLLSRYPALSHTFLLNEVTGLRALGCEIATASVNAPDRALEKLSDAERAESSTTFYLKQDKSGAVASILGTLITRPQVVFRGLLAVMRMRGLTFRGRALWFAYLAEALVVGRWMQHENLPHLHVHFGGPVASVGMLASIAWKVPYSLTIHGPEELLDARHHWLREKVQQASFVICISDFCRSQLCAISSLATWSKFIVVRLGVDPELLLPAEPRPASTSLRIVCTGRLVPEKGQRILVQALALLRARGVDISMTLIGRGPEELALRGIVKREHLSEFVEFTGGLPHSETLKRVRSADIFVLPSFAEGIPVALMEAMAFAVPCISTTVAGIPELIENGRDGLLVAPANVTALADAIATLCADASRRARLGASGRERILRDYNLPRNQQVLAAVFGERLSAETTRSTMEVKRS